MKEAESSFLQRIQNLTVEEFTTPCSFLIQPETSLPDAEKIMQREKIRHLPVVDHEKNVVGIISDRDIHFAHPPSSGNKSAGEGIYEKRSLLRLSACPDQ